jgi:hypothetical protein
LSRKLLAFISGTNRASGVYSATRAAYVCYFYFVVVESDFEVFCEEDDESGLEESDFTSLLFELLLDSVVVVGAGEGAGATTVVVEPGVVGVCSQPVSVRPSVARANATNNLYE